MCVSRSALSLHVCQSVWLVCACVSVGLPCVRMCVSRTALCVHACQSVCHVCACVSVGLPCGSVGLPCVCMCVSVGLPCVCMCDNRSAMCVLVCQSDCMRVSRSVFRVHVPVGRPCVSVDLP